MRKKLFYIVLAGCLTFGTLTACGNEKAEQVLEEVTAKSEEATEKEETAEETPVTEEILQEDANSEPSTEDESESVFTEPISGNTVTLTKSGVSVTLSDTTSEQNQNWDNFGQTASNLAYYNTYDGISFGCELVTGDVLDSFMAEAQNLYDAQYNGPDGPRTEQHNGNSVIVWRDKSYEFPIMHRGGYYIEK